MNWSTETNKVLNAPTENKSNAVNTMDEARALENRIEANIKASDGSAVAAIDRQQKHIEKQNRQQLKIQCLNIANQNGLSAKEIVEQAKAFYAFVRT